MKSLKEHAQEMLAKAEEILALRFPQSSIPVYTDLLREMMSSWLYQRELLLQCQGRVQHTGDCKCGSEDSIITKCSCDTWSLESRIDEVVNR